MPNELTTAESKSLLGHEKVIEKGRKAFFEVGQALLAIREGKLYKATHKTFEAYCKDRWDLSRDYAYKQIAAAEAVAAVKTVDHGLHFPASERQARPLTSVPTEEVGEVWQEVVDRAPRDDDGEPVITAKHIKAVVDEQYGSGGGSTGFDYDREQEWLFETLRRKMDIWPPEYRETLSQILALLAEEALT